MLLRLTLTLNDAAATHVLLLLTMRCCLIDMSLKLKTKSLKAENVAVGANVVACYSLSQLVGCSISISCV